MILILQRTRQSEFGDWSLRRTYDDLSETNEGKTESDNVIQQKERSKGKQEQNRTEYLFDDFLLNIIRTDILREIGERNGGIGDQVRGFLIPNKEPIGSSRSPTKKMEIGVKIARNGHLGLRPREELGRLGVEFEGQITATVTTPIAIAIAIAIAINSFLGLHLRSLTHLLFRIRLGHSLLLRIENWVRSGDVGYWNPSVSECGCDSIWPEV